jgi:hypothetical protein
MDYKEKFLKYKEKYQKILHNSGGVNLSINNLISSPYDVLEPGLFKNDPYRPTFNNKIENFLPPVNDTRTPITNNFTNTRIPITNNFSHTRIMPRIQYPVNRIRYHQPTPLYIINTPTSTTTPPPPPKTLVKKINGIYSFSYFDFKHNNKPYKIMVCGTWHNYCYNKTFCEEPCDNNKQCYNLIELIKKNSETKCIDLFTESRFTKKLKNFNYTSIMSGGSDDLNEYLFRTIERFFLNNVVKFFIDPDTGIFLNATEIKNLSKNDFITNFTKQCSFKNNLFTQENLEDIYDFIQDGKKSTIEAYNEEQKKNIFRYLDFSIEGRLMAFGEITHKNIRNNLWDIRNVKVDDKIYSSPLFFLPNFMESSSNAEKFNIDIYDEKFTDYKNAIRREYDPTNPDLPEMMSGLVIYFSDFSDPTVREYFEKGKEFYNRLYNIFSSFYNSEIIASGLNIVNTVKEFSKLIKKQIKKSIFNSDQKKFYNILLRTYNISFRDVSEISLEGFYTSFELGFIISDIYAIPRMFKIDMDPFKNPQQDKCDQNDYFKNIVYVGGDMHASILNYFIKIYFNVTPIVEQRPTNSRIRCVEFNSPQEFFKD